jgi:hypothetical protein
MDVVGITHNDLDALGTILCIQDKLSIKEWFSTNYADLPEVVSNVIDYCKKNNVHRIVIGDVSFSDNKNLLTDLYEYITQFDDGFILHCDHHSYPNSDTFWDRYPKMKVSWTDQECATLQLCKLFKITDESLIKLCKIIDAYDRGQRHSEFYPAALMLNDYFWDFTKANSDGTKESQYNRIVILANMLKESQYKLPGNFKEVCTRIKEKAENDYNTFVQHHILNRYNADVKTTIILSQESFIHIQNKEFNAGQDLVVGIANGLFQCRVNSDSGFSLTFLRELRYKLCNDPDYCHPNAFTYIIKDASSDGILKEVQKILTVINSIPRDIEKCSADDFDDLPF